MISCSCKTHNGERRIPDDRESFEITNGQTWCGACVRESMAPSRKAPVFVDHLRTGVGLNAQQQGIIV